MATGRPQNTGQISNLCGECGGRKYAAGKQSAQAEPMPGMNTKDQIKKHIAGQPEFERHETEALFSTSMKPNHTPTMNENKPNSAAPGTFAQTFFHGTKADLRPGDYIETGRDSNYWENKSSEYIYLTATLDAAIWGAELARGEGRERIYLVEPTGAIENDPDLTDKKFKGNPTMSYRSKFPFRVLGEVTAWQSHPAEQVKAMKDAIARLKAQEQK